jgi:hypothetical protein
MTETIAKRTEPALLRDTLHGVVHALGTAAAEQVGLRIETIPGPPHGTAKIDLLATLRRPMILVRASLGGLDAGHSLWFALDVLDAVTLVAAFEKLPEETIAVRRRTPAIGAGELELFAQIAREICAGIGAHLAAALGDSTCTIAEIGTLQPGRDRGRKLGPGPFVVDPFELLLGEQVRCAGLLLIEPETAARWNQGTPELEPPPPPESDTGGTVVASDDEDEEIPIAPIRGRLAAFLTAPESFTTVRRSCRRAGLELVSYARTDIPNPSAHRNQIVLLELQAGDDRRYDWCKRIKTCDPAIKVVLLIHRPSRQRVLQGFVAGADAILGWPFSEGLLAHKLESLLGAGR